VYVVVRITGLVSTEQVESLAKGVFDAERVDSFVVRLSQEDPFIDWTMQRPLLGWGGHGRNWPIDALSGTEAVRQVDAQWLTSFSKGGMLGLFAFCGTFVMGPLRTLRALARTGRRDYLSTTLAVVLCVSVGLFLIDCLFNGMANPAYTLVAGALAGFGEARTRR